MGLYKYSYKGKYKEIIENWGDLEDCENYEKLIDEWLTQFNDEEKIIALRLLNKFQMYRRKYLAEEIKKLYNKLINQFEWAKDVKTFFMLADLKDKISNSTQFACEFQKTIGINVYRNIATIEPNFIDLLNNKIIFIDDYSGTGLTFINTLDLLINHNSKFKEFQFVFLVVNASETALTNILSYANLNMLNITIINNQKSEKAFKDNFIFDSNELVYSKNKYFNLCKTLSITNLPFGFMGTESLIAFDNCVPNNNLSLFRDKSNLYKPLIYRHRPYEDDFLKNSKLKYSQYEFGNKFKTTKNIFNFKLLIFILYCIMHGQSLNVSNACKLFGMTSTQYLEKIEFCKLNNLIVNENERYCLGRNFYYVFENCGTNKTIIKIVKNFIKGKFIIGENEFCDIIKYTPVDFEKRFKGYKRED